MTARIALRSFVLVALVLMAACGKKSAPVAPGPTDQIIYPRNYPNTSIQQD